jgi:hypothetical protein
VLKLRSLLKQAIQRNQLVSATPLARPVPDAARQRGVRESAGQGSQLCKFSRRFQSPALRVTEMNKKKALRNILLAVGLVAISIAVTVSALYYILFFMSLPR